MEYARWSQRGGRETWFPLGLGDFVLPLGTNRVSRLRVLSGGMVETFPALNGPGSVCAAREAASLVPGVSRFWSADAEGGAKVLRWDGVFAERDGRTVEEVRERAVMVGDRKQDIGGAKENGLRTIGVSWGYAPEGELQEAGADFIVYDTEELTALVRKMKTAEDVDNSAGASL